MAAKRPCAMSNLANSPARKSCSTSVIGKKRERSICSTSWRWPKIGEKQVSRLSPRIAAGIVASLLWLSPAPEAELSGLYPSPPRCLPLEADVPADAIAVAAIDALLDCPDVLPEQVLFVLASAQASKNEAIVISSLQGLLRACHIPDLGERCRQYAIAVIRYVSDLSTSMAIR